MRIHTAVLFIIVLGCAPMDTSNVVLDLRDPNGIKCNYCENSKPLTEEQQRGHSGLFALKVECPL